MYFTISGDDAVARRRRRSRPRGADGVGLQHVVQEEPREDPGRVLSMRAPRQTEARSSSSSPLDANPPTTRRAAMACSIHDQKQILIFLSAIHLYLKLISTTAPATVEM